MPDAALLNFELRARTITVSGYQPIMAQTLVRPDGTIFGAVRSGDHLQLQIFGGVPTAPALVMQVWCPGCRKLVPAASTLDMRLGFKGYCGECVQGLADRCRLEHGRLPGPEEFYCLSGSHICDRNDLCPPEADGRRRLRCRSCRLAQLYRGRARRKLAASGC